MLYSTLLLVQWLVGWRSRADESMVFRSVPSQQQQLFLLSSPRFLASTLGEKLSSSFVCSADYADVGTSFFAPCRMFRFCSRSRLEATLGCGGGQKTHTRNTNRRLKSMYSRHGQFTINIFWAFAIDVGEITILFHARLGFDFLQLKHRENKKKTTNNHFFPHRRRSSVALNHTKIALFSFCRCFFHLET